MAVTMRDVDTVSESVEMAEKVGRDALELTRRSDVTEPTKEKARRVQDAAADLVTRSNVLKEAVEAEAQR